VWLQNRKIDLDSHQNIGFGFGSVSPQKRGFGFGFKTDPGLLIMVKAKLIYGQSCCFICVFNHPWICSVIFCIKMVELRTFARTGIV